MKKESNKKLGFTLPEVLITLGIIGIVSALTIPTLVKEYKKKVLLNRIKVAHSQLVNGINLYVAQNNCSDMLCLFDTKKSSDEVRREFVTVLRGAKICENENDINCKQYYIKHKDGLRDNGEYAPADVLIGTRRTIFKNGSFVEIVMKTSCIRSYSSEIKDEQGYGTGKYVTYTEDSCANIYIDSNGIQPPNQFGADVFRLNVTSAGRLNQPAEWASATTVIQNNMIDYFEHEIGQAYK